MKQRYQTCLAALKARGQEHVLRWWDELGLEQRRQLLTDAEGIPWGLVDDLIPSHVLTRPARSMPADLRPAEVYPQRPRPEQTALYEEAIERGHELIRAGKVGAFTVAGGQGTRLGFDGPKGAVVVTPVGNRTLFELFAMAVAAARDRYAAPIPWYIMTSAANYQQTVDFLNDHDYFGLPREDVLLFNQGMLPLFGFDGRILMESKHGIALGPDGHGGSLKALANSGALADMKARGVEIISYFQVDNPLARPFDPLFIGLHAETGAEMSIKVTPKADDLERMGNVCAHEGRVMVIEYSDFPDECARARNPDGSRMFDAGNLAIHLLSVDFVDRVVGRSLQLPFRRADKAVRCIGEDGTQQTPAGPNAVKLEMFVFDALALAENPLVLEVDRAEEFSPVKNAAGVDSLETARRDQIARACRWLESAGISVPRKPDGQPDLVIAIAPSFALDAEDVKAKSAQVPPLNPGDALYLE